MRPDFIPVGAVVNAHGIRGEVKVNPAGFDPEFIASFKTLYIGGQPVKVISARVHKSTVLLALPGVATMDDALALKGKTVSIRRTDAKLPKGQYFDAELEGCTVLDDATGEELGKLDKVLHYPAHKVYQVRGGAHEYLIPAVPEVFIASADPDAGIIRVHMMKGLAPMRIDIMTLFPDAVEAMMGSSIIGRARERGFVTIQTHQIRDYTTNKQMQVDDYPYGGGRGAVMQADPLYRCWQHICDEAGERVHTIYMSPCGRVLTQQVARELKAQYDHLILVCGHYEGVDQRFLDACVDEEISTGDFVLTGGEIPAMALADCLCRMVPGVLPEESCYTDESHWNGLLEYPQYSRPEEWHGRRVPEVLLSGHHGNVADWRTKESYKRTMARRPDMWARFDLTQVHSRHDKKVLAQALEEYAREQGGAPETE